MHLTFAYFKIKKRNLVLINNDTYQRETVSERPIRQPLRRLELIPSCPVVVLYSIYSRLLRSQIIMMMMILGSMNLLDAPRIDPI